MVAPFQASAPWRSQWDSGLGGKAELRPLRLQPVPVPPQCAAKGLFDLVAELREFDLCPSAPPVLRFWLQAGAVVMSSPVCRHTAC